MDKINKMPKEETFYKTIRKFRNMVKYANTYEILEKYISYENDNITQFEQRTNESELLVNRAMSHIPLPVDFTCISSDTDCKQKKGYANFVRDNVVFCGEISSKENGYNIRKYSLTKHGVSLCKNSSGILMGCADSAFYLKHFNMFHNKSESIQNTQISFDRQNGFCRAVAFHPSDILCGIALNNQIKLYDVDKQKDIGVIQPHDSSITGLIFSRAGNVMISSSIDHKIMTYDMVESRKVYDISFPNEVMAISANKEESMVAASFSNGKINIFDSRESKAVRSIGAHNGCTTALRFSSINNFILASAGYDGAVKLFDLRNEDILRNQNFYCNYGTPLCLSFGEGNSLWCGTKYGELKCWDIENSNVVFHEIFLDAAIFSILFDNKLERRSRVFLTTSNSWLYEVFQKKNR